jgi:hypothetical protein
VNPDELKGMRHLLVGIQIVVVMVFVGLVTIAWMTSSQRNADLARVRADQERSREQDAAIQARFDAAKRRLEAFRDQVQAAQKEQAEMLRKLETKK